MTLEASLYRVDKEILGGHEKKAKTKTTEHVNFQYQTANKSWVRPSASN